MLDAQLVVLVDEDLGEERLVAEPPVRVVAAGVDVGAAREEPERVVEVGSGVGVVHNFRNTGDEPLVLYTVYSPPEHSIDAVYATKELADAAEASGEDAPPQGAH